MIVLGILAALAGVVVIAVISWSAASRPGAEAQRNPVTAPAIDAASAQEMLSRLPTVSGVVDAPYQRDLFGERWADVDGNGCDTRNDVLARDLSAVVFREGSGECKVLEGVLVDPYDGHTESFTSGEQTSPLVQIDHIVALAWAWRHGADRWSDAERLVFANDPANLVVTADEINSAKSDSGPAEWMPPAAASVCGYVIAWVSVVDAYDLGITGPDREAARSALTRC